MNEQSKDSNTIQADIFRYTKQMQYALDDLMASEPNSEIRTKAWLTFSKAMEKLTKIDNSRLTDSENNMLLKIRTAYKEMRNQNSYMIAEKGSFEILKAEVDTINIVSSKNLTP